MTYEYAKYEYDGEPINISKIGTLSNSEATKVIKEEVEKLGKVFDKEKLVFKHKHKGILPKILEEKMYANKNTDN